MSDQLIDEIESIDGMWKRYAQAQRVFARMHNREVTISDVNDSDKPRLEYLGASAVRANEELVLLLFDVIAQLKEQGALTMQLAREVDRIIEKVDPEESIN